MRTIKFRGQKQTNGVWVYGDLETKLNRIHKYDNDGNYAGFVNVNPDTIGQFTGLLDSNGREIYEGDIIKNGTFVGVVDWNPIGNFFINENYGKRQDKCISLGEMLENHYFIVVGNIHDNPDLMKGEEK